MLFIDPLTLYILPPPLGVTTATSQFPIAILPIRYKVICVSLMISYLNLTVTHPLPLVVTSLVIMFVSVPRTPIFLREAMYQLWGAFECGDQI